jgi:hypothetical protein
MTKESDKMGVDEWIRDNPLSQALLEGSHLEPEILKALLLYYWGEDMTFEKMARKLKIKRPGAWKRWRKGLDAIMRSFYTIELAIYAGVLDEKTAKILVRDLEDYVELAQGGKDLKGVRDRIEKRMVEMKKRASKGTY